jgi:hypothetical protein
MNIYNFIFCYFYKKNGTHIGGKISGSGHVFVGFLMQILFLSEIIRDITSYNILIFSDNSEATYMQRKYEDFIFCVPIITGFYFFYNNERVKRILKKFDARDEYVQQGDTNRVILYIVVPAVLTIVFALIRQGGFA